MIVDRKGNEIKSQPVRTGKIIKIYPELHIDSGVWEYIKKKAKYEIKDFNDLIIELLYKQLNA
jgi:hypothetical protein